MMQKIAMNVIKQIITKNAKIICVIAATLFKINAYLKIKIIFKVD